MISIIGYIVIIVTISKIKGYNEQISYVDCNE